MKSEIHRLWYVKLDGTISGPFPGGAIAQDLMLGRLPGAAQISGDRITWGRVAVGDPFLRLLDPDRKDAWTAERLEALRRWADQRSGQDRRSSGLRAGPDRRRSGGWQRSVSPPRHPGRSEMGWAAVAGLGVVLLALAAAAALLGHAPPIHLLR